MENVEKFISPLIESQFPAFYREEGPKFIAFMKAYYEWLEQGSYTVDGEDVSPKTLYYARRLFDIKDVDKTADEFIVHFKEKYLSGISLEEGSDVRNLLKHSLELYRSKGSQRSIELLISLLYGEEVEIYLPGQDVLKASDATWYVPRYLEIEPNDLTKNYVGKQIYGATSGATALVEGFARRNVRGKIIDVLYISSVTGDFTVGELVSDEILTTANPRVIGSLTSITISTSGRDFSVGDVVDVVSEVSGIKGKARVTAVGSATGRVDYLLIDGGAGYSTTATVIVSEKVLSTNQFNTLNPYVSSFSQLEQVEQQLANVQILSPQGNLLNANTLVFGVNSTAIVSAGYVYNGNTTANTKFLSIAVHNVSNVSVNSINGGVVETGSFFLNERVYQRDITSANTYVGSVISANTTTVLLDDVVGSLQANTKLYGVLSLCEANVVAIDNINGSFSAADDIVTSGNAATGNCIIDTVADETAVGYVVGSNSQAIGVYNVINYFRSPTDFTKAFVRNVGGTKTANVFAVSVGNPGGFSVGTVTDTETVFLNTDRIGGNNVSNVPYLSIGLSSGGGNVGFVDSIDIISGGSGYSNADVVTFTGGTPTVNAVAVINTHSNGTIESIVVTTPGTGYDSNPNVSISTVGGVGANIQLNMDYGWGFPKLPDADLGTIISLALNREQKTIGTIASLTNIDPGSNNNASPFTLVIEPSIAGAGRKNFNISLENVTRPFSVGEEITQEITQPAVTIEVSGVSDDFTSRETLRQVRSDGNTVYGEIVDISIASNTGTIQVLVSNTANTFDTSNTVVGLESLAIADADNVIEEDAISVGKGVVLSSSNLSSNTLTLSIKRTKFGTSFKSGIGVTGSSSGAVGNVALITEISDSPVMGNNAIVSSVTGVANGTIEGLEVIDSGFGYRQDEPVELRLDGNPFVATGYIDLQKQGVGEGYWLDTGSFISSNKYIIDSYYYQEFSYEVRVGLALDKYAEIVKQLVQVAGTKLFGSFTKTTVVDLEVGVAESSLTISS